VVVLATRAAEGHHPSISQDGQTVDLLSGQSYFLTGQDRPVIQGGVLLLRITGQPGESTLPQTSSGPAVIPEHIIHHSDEGLLSEIVPAHAEAGFVLCKLEVASRRSLKLPSPFALVLCVGGSGRMFWAADSCEITRGRYYFIPYGVPWVEFATQENLALLAVMPSG
jgi:mannose-6-phosphate isomerase class I